MIEIIGAPFDLGGRRLGSRLGPAAIRLANLEASLTSLGFETRDLGDIEVPSICQSSEGFPCFDVLLPCIRELKQRVAEVLDRGGMPLVLGGEHTLAMGGISAAIAQAPGQVGLVWIDAHADVNTPGSSDSGNVHGMPIAALLGLESETQGVRDQQWQTLLRELGPNRLDPSQLAWYGLREVDPSERARVRQGFAVTMNEIDRHGIEQTVKRLDRFLRSSHVKQLWISFDVDALDPILAPGTGTAVRGGLTYREAHLFAELVREILDERDCPYQLMGVDLVETNPLIDSHNETATMAAEWLASLLGKTILG